ncbi:hypothetical protein ACFQY4_18880 [Catellatospora bangladeshensis]|uniref:hypothetical protein n=1 Tax=Catellatospora bangladeshensis TaxID=310355 RepID=UPI00361F0E04
MSGRACAVPGGNTVSRWAASRMRRVPLPLIRAITASPSAQPSSSLIAVVRTCAPASAAYPARRAATLRRPSTCREPESISTSSLRRARNAG